MYKIDFEISKMSISGSRDWGFCAYFNHLYFQKLSVLSQKTYYLIDSAILTNKHNFYKWKVEIKR